jgi:hypothetical protein
MDMKLKAILMILVIGFAPFALSQESSTSDDLELRSIRNLIVYTEKLALDKTARAQLKYAGRELDRVRELWQIGKIPNSLTLLLNIRNVFYKYGSSGPLQTNLQSAMKRLWPFLLKSGRFRSDGRTFHGITFVRLLVPEGSLTMSFPTDAKPGEVVSGRIQASSPSLASLYLMSFMGAPVVADGSLQKWNLPEAFELHLTDQWGNELIRTQQKLYSDVDLETDNMQNGLPREKQPREPRQNIEIPNLRFQISARSKAGDYLVVKGPFDGDFSTTNVGIGQYQGYIVTESPRHLIVALHPQMTGNWTVYIRENDNNIRCRVTVQSEDVDPFSTLTTCHL